MLPQPNHRINTVLHRDRERDLGVCQAGAEGSHLWVGADDGWAALLWLGACVGSGGYDYEVMIPGAGGFDRYGLIGLDYHFADSGKVICEQTLQAARS